jgi:hypothetical protein
VASGGNHGHRHRHQVTRGVRGAEMGEVARQEGGKTGEVADGEWGRSRWVVVDVIATSHGVVETGGTQGQSHWRGIVVAMSHGVAYGQGWWRTVKGAG